MTESAAPYVFTLCYAADTSGPLLLLARRQLIQKRVAGAMVRGTIPSWAGQWGLIAGRSQQPSTLEQAAYAALLAQTGIDLGYTEVALRYGVIRTGAQRLQDSNHNPVLVFYVATRPDGLRALAADINANLDAQTIDNGVLQQVELTRMNDALARIGPLAPPPDGWASYVVNNYYGGHVPGPLDTTFPMLVSELSRRSTKLAESFRLAITHVPV